MKKVCIFPFMHALIQPDGKVKLCCNSENENSMPTVTEIGIDNILNNKHHVSIRKAMLNGEKPDVCKRCWKNESLGIESYRQQQFRTYPHHILKLFNTNKEGIISNGVKYLDVRFNNTCNLKCVNCSSEYSTSWIDDEKKIVEITTNKRLKEDFQHRTEVYDKERYKWAHDKEIFDSIIANAKSLDRLHFAGGEPLLSKQHIPLLKELIKLGLHKNLFLSYNTNGEFIDQELLDLWSHFKRVKIFYSLDHVYEKNEYLRFPSKWNTVEEKFDLIEESSPNNIDWRLLTTVNAINILYLPEFVDWKIRRNFKRIHNSWLDGRISHAMPVDYPRYLNAGVLPAHVKDVVQNKLNTYTSTLPRRYRSNYQKIIDDNISFMLETDYSFLIDNFRSLVTDLDTIRGTDFNKVFPELSTLLNT